MRILLALFIVTLGLPSADAQELILRVDAELTCIKASELQSSLELAGHRVLDGDVNGDFVVQLLGDATQVQVEITGGDTALREKVAKAPCETQTEVAAALIITTLAGLVSETPIQDKIQTQESQPLPNHSLLSPDYRIQQRATLLTPYLERFDGSSSQTLAIATTVTGGLLTSVALLALREEPSVFSASLTFGGATILGGGIASLLVEEDYQLTVGSIATFAGLSGISLATSFLGDDRPEILGVQRPILLVSSAVAGLTAGIILTETLLERPVSPATLERHYKRLRDPEKRAQLTHIELKQIERDFRRSQGVFPLWVRASPLVLQATGMFYIAAVTDDRDQRDTAYILGGITALMGAGVYLLSRHIGYDGYQRDLGFAKLNVALTSGGLGVRGEF